jgi:hypothetical protein
MTPEARHALRRVASVWTIVAIVELVLWWTLYRSRFYQPLWITPALLALVGGVVATVQAVRVRNRERRAGDRRADSRRAGAPDAAPPTA